MGIEVPTPIQRLSIQPVLDGRDVIAKAETGTGKTLAFGAPIMARVDPGRASVLALVLCPTRELAQQVCDVLTELGAARGVKVALIVGGEEAYPQVNALKGGAQVVVGTPGRVLDLMGQGFLSFPWTEYAVLDEADEMLEIGFLDDVKKILAQTPDERQTLLFSATFPAELLKLARGATRDPLEIATAKGIATVDQIDQSFIEVEERDKELALIRLLEQSDDDDVFLVFCERRTAVDRLMRRLERLPFGIKALHGGYDQAARFRVMSAFRDGGVKALVATDVASRGLDVAHVTTVVNFGVPREVTDYTHRIGRTGRAGRSGRAITIVDDRRRWSRLLRQMTWDVEEREVPSRYRRNGGDRGRSEGERPRSRRRDAEEERPRSRRRDVDDERPRARARGDERERPSSRRRGTEGERPRSRRGEAEEDRPRSRARDPEGERPRSRRREAEEDRPRSRTRGAEEERPRSRRGAEEERLRSRRGGGDDEQPRSRGRDGDGERPRSRQRDGDDERPRSRQRDGDDERPRSRQREGDDERPRSRQRDGDDERSRSRRRDGSERPRARRHDGDDEQPRARRHDGDDGRPRARHRDGDDERPRARHRDEDDERPRARHRDEDDQRPRAPRRDEDDQRPSAHARDEGHRAEREGAPARRRGRRGRGRRSASE